MQFRQLGRTGYEVSVIGFGASTLGNVFGDVSSSAADEAVGFALDEGINLFDVSPYYGNTLAEERLGQALRGRRSSAYLATKCGRYGIDQFDFSAEKVTRSLEDSLRRLQTDRIDLYQAHDIEFGHFDQIVEETLPALERLKQQGKVRAIGITGYWPGFLARALRQSQLDSVLNYCHANLFVEDMQVELVPAARDAGLGILNASPLHMGLLGNREVPAWHPAPAAIRKAAAEVKAICESFDRDPAALALKTCVDFPGVDSTFIGISSKTEVKAACAALEFDAPQEMLDRVRAVLAPVKNVVWPQGRPENEDRAPIPAGNA